jgi:hypothetical protein
MHKVVFPPKLLNLCRILNNEIYCKVKIVKLLSSEFKVNKGLRQGDAIAHFLFNAVLETAIRILFKYPTRRTNYPNLFCHKTLHVSGILSAHHQEFSTVHSALVSSILTLLGNGHYKPA